MTSIPGSRNRVPRGPSAPLESVRKSCQAWTLSTPWKPRTEKYERWSCPFVPGGIRESQISKFKWWLDAIWIAADHVSKPRFAGMTAAPSTQLCDGVGEGILPLGLDRRSKNKYRDALSTVEDQQWYLSGYEALNVVSEVDVGLHMIFSELIGRITKSIPSTALQGQRAVTASQGVVHFGEQRPRWKTRQVHWDNVLGISAMDECTGTKWSSTPHGVPEIAQSIQRMGVMFCHRATLVPQTREGHISKIVPTSMFRVCHLTNEAIVQFVRWTDDLESAFLSIYRWKAPSRSARLRNPKKTLACNESLTHHWRVHCSWLHDEGKMKPVSDTKPCNHAVAGSSLGHRGGRGDRITTCLSADVVWKGRGLVYPPCATFWRPAEVLTAAKRPWKPLVMNLRHSGVGFVQWSAGPEPHGGDGLAKKTSGSVVRRRANGNLYECVVEIQGYDPISSVQNGML
ncbi:hypothetical protein BV22DRAFT_1047126 [Leucogyrophana mollusca]|uniref:Uncharacterized protein n=1 Tax=Leucogyrophana mollusca TaxID=85980 RepID=A0ACB8BK29_9AGAM|nr:hypothetical protein BV22DRAFT_1047126 [Leucogyrophana mollusca]